MINFKSLLLFGYFITTNLFCVAQQKDSLRQIQIDSLRKEFNSSIKKNLNSVGILITKKQFDSVFKYYSHLVIVTDKCDNLNNSAFVEIIRIYNTITIHNEQYERYFNAKKYSQYEEIVGNKLIPHIIKKLQAGYSIGGAFYSKKYDIFIGGPPHSNSMYKIMD